MKKVFCLLLILLLCFPASSQEIVEAEYDVSSPFIYVNNIWRGGYRFADGEVLRARDVRRIVSSVPANETLLRQERRARISSLIFAGLAMGSVVATTTSLYIDEPQSSNMRNVSVGALVPSIVFTSFFDALAGNRLQQSVDNYNSYTRRQRR